MRYGHPCAVGVRTGGFPCRNRGSRLLLSRLDLHGGGVAVPRDDRLARLEAVFFLSQQPQTSRKLAQLAGLADGTKARTLVRSLNRRYDAGGSAFRVEEVAGGYQLMTRSKFAPWLRRLHTGAAEVRLSAPAMETLAVVAYRQPVLRAEIESIRGVQSGEVLRQLIERDLVRIAGRSDELGRPFLYATTKQFLQVFGLRRLDELPRADALRGREPTATQLQDSQIGSDTDIASQSNQSPVAEEETNVRTVITTLPRPEALAEESTAAVIQPRRNDRAGNQDVFNKTDEDEDEEDEDFDDLEEEDEDEEDDEDLDDEPWEEVEDEDLDEDLDEDEEEDWEDEDDDWDDDEEEDWEEEEEEEEGGK